MVPRHDDETLPDSPKVLRHDDETLPDSPKVLRHDDERLPDLAGAVGDPSHHSPRLSVPKVQTMG